MSEHGAGRAFVVLVPVKDLATAKSRFIGVDPATRRQLAGAFALDTVAAVLACPDVRGVVVIGADETLTPLLADSGCLLLADPAPGDLNRILRHGAASAQQRWPGCTPVALCADLPALRTADLMTALRGIGDTPAVVGDHHAVGTTMYAAPSPSFHPRFGLNSLATHLAAGAEEITVDVPSLRCDVDVLADLSRAVELGVGPHTRQVLDAVTLFSR